MNEEKLGPGSAETPEDRAARELAEYWQARDDEFDARWNARMNP